MKRIAVRTAVIAFVVFLIAWGVVGVKLLDGDYDITVGVYIAMAAAVITIAAILVARSTGRCPHCGRFLSAGGKYCPHCGKEVC